MKRIVADPTKCLACRGCEIACALAHAATDDLVVALFKEGAKPRIFIESAGKFAVPLQCRHCDDAPCVTVCPTGAVSRTSDSEPVLVDQAKCVGCEFCVEVCPFGVILVVPRGKSGVPGEAGAGKAVIKCDLCQDRQTEGLDPACVSACPVGALLFEDVDNRARSARARAAARAAASAGDGIS